MKNLIQAFKENPVTIVLAIGIIAIGTADQQQKPKRKPPLIAVVSL